MSGHLARELALDVDFETARALHRVVRAMHDGECPKCHAVVSSSAMRPSHSLYEMYLGDLVCPKCGFRIRRKEAEAAIAAFAPVMEKNLKVFEQWRNNEAPE